MNTSKINRLGSTPPPGNDRNNIQEELRALLAKHLRRPVSDVTDDASLERDLGMDSMSMIEINVSLEERFQVVMPDEILPTDIRVDTVADLAEFIAELIARRRREGTAS